MKATKVTMAPKATKSMKTMKAPKSVKTMKAATAKGKSQKAKDESPDKNKLGTDRGKRGSAIALYNLYDVTDRMGQRTISILGPTSKINLYYGAMPCTKTPDQLKKIATMIVSFLKARRFESKALQVHAYYT